VLDEACSRRVSVVPGSRWYRGSRTGTGRGWPAGRGRSAPRAGAVEVRDRLARALALLLARWHVPGGQPVAPAAVPVNIAVAFSIMARFSSTPVSAWRWASARMSGWATCTAPAASCHAR